MPQGGGNCSKTSFWGGLITQLRVERQLSQRKLADEAHVNRSTLRRIEEGRARGDIDTIERLLSRMGYELEAMEQSTIERMKQAEAEDAIDPDKVSHAALARLLRMEHGAVV